MNDISISAYEQLLCTAPQLLAEHSAANMKLNWNDRFLQDAQQLVFC